MHLGSSYLLISYWYYPLKVRNHNDAYLMDSYFLETVVNDIVLHGQLSDLSVIKRNGCHFYSNTYTVTHNALQGRP